MSIEILHDYRFPGGTIIELKFKEISPDAPKYYIYQWYLTNGDQRYELDFIRMDGNKRVLFNKVLGIVTVDLDNMTIFETGVKLKPSFYDS